MKMYGPVSSFSQSVISQLGGLAIELPVEELNSLRLTERRSIASMGAVSAWSNRQVAAFFTGVNILGTFTLQPYKAKKTQYLSITTIKDRDNEFLLFV